jgi:transketolase
MRNGFVDALMDLADSDPGLVLLTPDMGYSVFEKFEALFPDRYYNVGISEQGMIGIASGMAMAGFTPVCYSLVPFVLFRAFEQVRIDICLHNLNIKLIGGGAGWSYESQGSTHHAIEDVAVSRSLPNLMVFSPCDYYSAKQLTKHVFSFKGPAYIRLGRNTNEQIYGYHNYKINQYNLLRYSNRKETLIVSTGRMTRQALKVHKKLNETGIDVDLLDVLQLKPIESSLIKVLQQYNKIITIEEHSLVGGLGSVISQVLFEAGLVPKFIKIGLEDKFCDICGDTDYIDSILGLDVDSLYTKVINLSKT